MTTEQTAQQFELAAKLIRTGHPWKSSPQAPDTDIYSALRDGFEILPVLATPPDGRPLHNPDNLTAEQVGVGYRLLCAEDGVPSGKVDTWMFGGWCSAYAVDKKHLHECDKTYRLFLSVPWPEVKPDPYADEKETVPLGPDDVPPGSVFRSKDQPDTSFWTVSQVWTGGFYLRGESMPWDTARERMQINRSIPLTGKWNPDAWESCSKQIDA